MFIELNELLKMAVAKNASDIHITVGSAPAMRINGNLAAMEMDRLSPEDTSEYARLCLNDEKFKVLKRYGEVDCSLSLHGIGRFRVNVYRQRGSDAVAIRVLSSEIPELNNLNLPPAVKQLCELREGLVLVTGPSGSGKSTTVAAILNEINRVRSAHIITLEDPIEYMFRHDRSIINQREIGQDSLSYSRALKSALREDPDVIFIGEMRDFETIGIAVTAAETGHLILSTLHTIGAAKTIDRLIDVFPPHHQQQIRAQVSTTLKAVISQRLIPDINEKGRLAAVELMIVTPAIGNLIREGKTSGINMAIQTGASLGMQQLDKVIAELYKSQQISKSEAFSFCIDRNNLKRLIGIPGE